MSYDCRMRWYHPAGIILALLVGLGLGRALAPRYHAPVDSGEARLRARAVELYQAGRLFDMLKIHQLYTPARQLAEKDALLKEATKQGSRWDTFDEKTKKEQEASAAKVVPDSVQVQLYTGDGWGWAVTSGKAVLLVEGQEIEQQLEQVIWVQNNGDWWIYEQTPDELNAYGNPPDPILKILQSPARRQQQYERARQAAQEAAAGMTEPPAQEPPAQEPPAQTEAPGA
jgi:hypothetical protein